MADARQSPVGLAEVDAIRDALSLSDADSDADTDAYSDDSAALLDRPDTPCIVYMAWRTRDRLILTQLPPEFDPHWNCVVSRNSQNDQVGAVYARAEIPAVNEHLREIIAGPEADCRVGPEADCRVGPEADCRVGPEADCRVGPEADCRVCPVPMDTIYLHVRSEADARDVCEHLLCDEHASELMPYLLLLADAHTP